MSHSVAGGLGAARADIRMEMLELPTYTPGPDNPFPDFGWMSRWERYPYSVRTDISAKPEILQHRCVVLENEYVKAVVLPDIGGRLFRLFDKVAGKDCFMTPPSLKYQNISQRGAWLAGGLEFNWGTHHHTANTVSPVTWSMRQDEDGGVSVWVGTVTMPVQSRWALRISLKPGRSAVDLEIHTMGPDALPGLNYWWTNAGVEVSPLSRFYYFGKRAIHHGWPICDGLDFSWYRNRLTGSDMFLMECQRDYMGFYDFGRQHGVANTADRFQAPGQKYFTWGNHQMGHFWDSLFSDTGQSYCELQRGRHPSQGVNDSLDPMTEDVWSETWIPLGNTGGFSGTENDLVLSVNQEEGSPGDLRLVSLVARKNLTVQAQHGEKVLGKWQLKTAAPDAMFTQPLAGLEHCDRVKVWDDAGHLLMDWEEFQYVNDDQTGTHPAPHQPLPADPETADSLFAQAQWQRFSNWPRQNPDSIKLYNRVLSLDPAHAGAMQAMAEIHAHQGRHEQALECVKKALLRDSFNHRLMCLEGWTLLSLRRIEEALESFGNAARTEAGRRKGSVGMALAYLHMGKLPLAEAAIGRLLAEAPGDKWAGAVKVLILRKAGRVEEARKLLAGLLERDPLWPRLHAETLLLGMTVNLAQGSRKIGDDSVFAAMPYIELGLWHDARQILQTDETNEPFSPAIQLAHLAYVQEKLGDAAAKATLERLASADAAQANPWLTPSIEILQDLITRHPNEPMLHLMLGNLLSSRSRLDEAALAWQHAADLSMKSPVVYRNLACRGISKGQKLSAEPLYAKAWELGKGELNLFCEYERLLGSVGKHEERLRLYDQLSPVAQNRSMVAMRRVPQLLDVERYEDAVKELKSRQFFRAEMEFGARYFWVEAIMGTGLPSLKARQFDQAARIFAEALEYPLNVGIGRNGIFYNESIINYFIGMCQEAQGDPPAARENYLLAAHESHWEYSVMESYEMLAWLALGERHRAITLAHKLEEGYRKHSSTFWGANHAINFGLAQVAKGHVDVARTVWQKALADSPDARQIRFHLALPDWVLERMGRKATGKA